MKNYSQISAFTSFYKRHSKKLNGNRQMTQNLTVKSQRHTPPPPPSVETLVACVPLPLATVPRKQEDKKLWNLC